MRTSELTGLALDWAVATCEDKVWARWSLKEDYGDGNLQYSEDWSLAGPIIERERIDIYGFDGDSWGAEDNFRSRQYGDTPLIAAMRCYVASKLGDEIQIPEELTVEKGER